MTERAQNCILFQRDFSSHFFTLATSFCKFSGSDFIILSNSANFPGLKNTLVIPNLKSFLFNFRLWSNALKTNTIFTYSSIFFAMEMTFFLVFLLFELPRKKIWGRVSPVPVANTICTYCRVRRKVHDSDSRVPLTPGRTSCQNNEVARECCFRQTDVRPCRCLVLYTEQNLSPEKIQNKFCFTSA